MVPSREQVETAETQIRLINDFMDEHRYSGIPQTQWLRLCYQKRELYKVVIKARRSERTVEYARSI